MGNRENATVPLEPGVPIPAGSGFSVLTGTSDMAAEVHVTGYLMPANAVPAGTSGLAVAKGITRPGG